MAKSHIASEMSGRNQAAVLGAFAGINAAKKHGVETQKSKAGEVNQMISKIRNDRSAFTLVEIMIVVAIVGLLAALAVPGFVKARKQSQGRRILNDCRQQDAAIDQWALETGQTDGATVNTTGAATYLKTTWKSNDLLGNAFGPATMVVGTGQIIISTTTKSALAGVGIDWGPY
jgi:prepilin-type N-terminal cleavage/methylation domain-containing protein